MGSLKNKKLFLVSFIVYFVSLVLYTLFSYSLTAPNLVLSTNATFWEFQTYMWRTFFNNRLLLTQTYLVLVSTIFISYGVFSFCLIKEKIHHFKTLLILFFALLAPLLVSSNALSYDVFNYIFNAKMVMVYQVDPHVQVAMDFPDDPWLKFMHNIHTTAPYGKAWTYLSLLPFSLGFEKFILTWLNFRLFSLLPLVLLVFIFWKYKKKLHQSFLVLLIFNPLILIEVTSNFHNDFWMITPAISALLILDSLKKKDTFFILKVILSLVLLAFSVWVKLATVVLVPLWVIVAFKQRLIDIPRFSQFIRNWPLWASLLLFIPLLSSRSQQFHPWYLSWSIAFIPLFLKNKLSQAWAFALLVLSVSSLYRYTPFLYHNNYEGTVLLWQKAITFVPFVIALFFSLKILLPKKK